MSSAEEKILQSHMLVQQLSQLLLMASIKRLPLFQKTETLWTPSIKTINFKT